MDSVAGLMEAAEVTNLNNNVTKFNNIEEIDSDSPKSDPVKEKKPFQYTTTMMIISLIPIGQHPDPFVPFFKEEKKIKKKKKIMELSADHHRIHYEVLLLHNM